MSYVNPGRILMPKYNVSNPNSIKCLELVKYKIDMLITYLLLTRMPPYINLQPISKEGAGALVVLERVVKFISYYIHEKAWF